nr:probable membrane-associated kinase regulator 6 isoform X2 [Ipomoea trifida]GMD28191.1 putative E3 ubiquitin-protein ligase XBAT35 [Ipomoea batatas]
MESSLTLLHADELISNGFLVPLFAQSIKSDSFDRAFDSPEKSTKQDQWIDREGKTNGLHNPKLFDVANTLIELGANVNAYRPGTEVLVDRPLDGEGRLVADERTLLLARRGVEGLNPWS